MVCCSSPLSPSALRALRTWLLRVASETSRPVPDRLEQLLARQHPVAMADQVHEQVEHLGLDGDRHVPVADPVAGGVDDVIADPELPAIRRKHSMPFRWQWLPNH